MSEADGLVRLTQFLNQTKRQAEQAIDCLNGKIKELELVNESTKLMADKYLEERDYYKNYAEQLRIENSKKWRLQERDDWKALVDSVQRDRARLQEECNLMENSLLAARAEIDHLKETIATHSETLLTSKPLSAEITIDPTNPPTAAVSDGSNHEDDEEVEPCPPSSPSRIPMPVLDSQTQGHSNHTAPHKDGSTPYHSLLSSDGVALPLPISSPLRHNPTPIHPPVYAASPLPPPRTDSPQPPTHTASPSLRRPLSPLTFNPPRPPSDTPLSRMKELNTEISRLRDELETLRQSSSSSEVSQRQEIIHLRSDLTGLLLALSDCTSCSKKKSVVTISEAHRDLLHNARPITAPDPMLIPLTQPLPPAPPPPPSTVSSWTPFSLFGYFFSSRPSVPPPPSLHPSHQGDGNLMRV